MARPRILYSSKAVRIGTYDVKGVQSCTYGFELARTDVNAFGKLGAHDRILTTTPTVNTELQTLAWSGQWITVKTDMLSNSASTGRDVTIALANHNTDNDFTTGGPALKTKGNFVSAATAEASVGAFALHTIAWEGTGMESVAAAANAAATAPTAIPQEFVTASLTGFGVSGVCQSANMTVNITREVLEKFGTKFSDQRLIQFPASASLTLEGLDLVNAVNFSNLVAYSEAGVRQNAQFLINTKQYGLIGAIPDSVTFNGGIGDNHTVSMVLSTSIGSTGDTVHNFNWHSNQV